MLREVLQLLQLKPGLTVMDGTVGAGGHSAEILKQIGESGQLVGFDRDPMMLAHATTHLNRSNVTLVHAPYSDAAIELKQAGMAHVDRVLLDLGLSSDQLSDRNRGFGFDAGGNLDMRFDVSRGRPAKEFLKTCSRDQLVRVITEFGEEPQAERIADALHQAKHRGPIRSSEELADVVRRAVGSSEGRRDPATRVFQAFRIAVNEELRHLQQMLSQVLPMVLKKDGLAVIITFHSLEDRIVKSEFKGNQGWHVLTKTPLRPAPAEVRINPRSRSAKLRAAKWTSP
ncbi:MAG: 16S rRNA (cytosine(1402)-N(4))-methyltransferase RsmH [Fuerstiella sp.]|nr:16S rRNA (cytosine(1402)-N(4))-methyltransferase RsmH [Fuerstiella sp.]